jgi:hypothetical protein
VNPSIRRQRLRFGVCLGVCAAALLFAANAHADYPGQILGSNPIGYWRLGEASDALFVADQTGNASHLDFSFFVPELFGHQGAIVGDANSAVRLSPQLGGNAQLRGQNFGDFAFAPGESFSIEYWVKMRPGNGSLNGSGILTKGYDTAPEERPWYLSRYIQGGVDFFLRTGGGTSYTIFSDDLTDSQWHHVVGVYDAGVSQMRLYVDGRLTEQRGGVATAFYGTNPRPLVLGNHLNRAFDGFLDEVAVYNHALTGETIADHFAASGHDPRPVGFAREWLNVDFGSISQVGNGPGGRQTRFTRFLATEGASNPDVTTSIASLLGTNGAVDVTISGYTHFRNYAAVTGEFGRASALLSDGVLRNADGVMTLSLDGLLPGTYDMTTFHHSTQFGGGQISIYANDALGQGRVLAEALTVSASATPFQVSAAKFQLVVDGNNPVSVDFYGGGGSLHSMLNGFSLTPVIAQGKERVLAVDVNRRGSDSSTDPTVTQAGFSEFLLGGVVNEVIGGASVGIFGPYTVTIRPLGAATLTDRRRASPTNLGLFTDEQLLRDFIFAEALDAGDGLQIHVDGLKPNTTYDVRLWSFDTGSTGVYRYSDWYANDDLVFPAYNFIGSVLPAFNDEYSFSFPVTTDPNGELTVSGRWNGEGHNIGVFLNALEISELTGMSANPDLDGNGIVGRGDAILLLRNYGMTEGGSESLGDLNGDAVIGLADVAILQKNLDPRVGGAPAAAVPEPSTALLAASGLLGIWLVRRRARDAAS